MAAARHFYLGLLFLAVICVLGGYTLFLTDFSLFSEKIVQTVQFANTNGLREGDAVQVAGMRWGKIESFEYDPQAEYERRITVTISLVKPIVLHEDGKIAIKDATVLGGKVLAIEPGTPSSPVIPGGPAWSGIAQGNVLDTLGETVDELRKPLLEAAEDIQTLVADARNGTGVLHQLVYDEQLPKDLSAAVASVKDTFEDASQLTQDLRDGKGTLGKLFAETKLYDDIDSLASKAQSFLDDGQGLIRDAREGKGLLARILNDETLAGDAQQLVANVRKLSDQLVAGEGTLGKLFQDSGIADNLKQITDKLANGEGTLGKLLQDPELYDKVASVVDDLKVVSTNLRDGNGTIGKLINDDELYVELQRALKTLTGTLEEAREAAPITTLLNTLFLGF